MEVLSLLVDRLVLGRRESPYSLWSAFEQKAFVCVCVWFDTKPWVFPNSQDHMAVYNNAPNSWCFLLIIGRGISEGKWTAVCQSFTWRGKWAFRLSRKPAFSPFFLPVHGYDSFCRWSFWHLTLILRRRWSCRVNHAISLREQKMMLMRKASGCRERPF